VSRQRAADAALIWNTIVWGATFVVVKTALGHITPVLFLALRFSLATVALLALLRGVWKARWTWRSAGAGALTGTFLFSGYLLQTLGLQYTTAPKSAFLTGLTSVMVPLLAMIVYRTRPMLSEAAGIAAATLGMGLMTLEGSVAGISRGDLLTFFCAVAFAAHIVTLGHFSEYVDFEILSVTQIGAAALWSLLLFRWMETPRVEWQPAVVYAILVTALLATALAFTVQAWAQRFTSSTRTALIYMLEPVFAWLTSYFLVGEGLSTRAALGAVLILSGVVLVELKPFNPRLHPSK
jgi:drug/metabolite transporter (DMT)-like permease